MIEMLGEFIAGILGMIKKGDFQQATQALENAYIDFLKQDAAFFKSIDKDKLTESLINKHNYANGHLEILAELFYAEAELLCAKGKIRECIEFYEKSLLLSMFVEKETKLYSFEKQTKISIIQSRLAELKNGVL
jgi:hypothetical protein